MFFSNSFKEPFLLVFMYFKAIFLSLFNLSSLDDSLYEILFVFLLYHKLIFLIFGLKAYIYTLSFFISDIYFNPEKMGNARETSIFFTLFSFLFT